MNGKVRDEVRKAIEHLLRWGRLTIWTVSSTSKLRLLENKL